MAWFVIGYGDSAFLASCFWRTEGTFSGVLLSHDIRQVIM